MAIPSLRDFLRWMHGKDRKPQSVFADEKAALEFLERAYKDAGGVTPELKNAYKFYLQNYNDDCPPNTGSFQR